jgi:hypothetical protein
LWSSASLKTRRSSSAKIEQPEMSFEMCLSRSRLSLQLNRDGDQLFG